MNLPNRQYDIILVDPPWSYHGQQAKWGAAAKFYETMSDTDLRAMPVNQMAHKTSILFCWATGPRLDFAVDLIRHWVPFVWVKTTKAGVPIGARGVRPSIVKPTTEFVVAGSMTHKGRPMPLADESIQQVVMAPVAEHSRKPDDVNRRIERLYPNASRIELFARRPMDGWDVWGEETTKFS